MGSSHHQFVLCVGSLTHNIDTLTFFFVRAFVLLFFFSPKALSQHLLFHLTRLLNCFQKGCLPVVWRYYLGVLNANYSKQLFFHITYFELVDYLHYNCQPVETTVATSLLLNSLQTSASGVSIATLVSAIALAITIVSPFESVKAVYAVCIQSCFAILSCRPFVYMSICVSPICITFVLLKTISFF